MLFTFVLEGARSLSSLSFLLVDAIGKREEPSNQYCQAGFIGHTKL